MAVTGSRLRVVRRLRPALRPIGAARRFGANGDFGFSRLREAHGGPSARRVVVGRHELLSVRDHQLVKLAPAANALAPAEGQARGNTRGARADRSTWRVKLEESGS